MKTIVRTLKKIEIVSVSLTDPDDPYFAYVREDNLIGYLCADGIEGFLHLPKDAKRIEITLTSEKPKIKNAILVELAESGIGLVFGSELRLVVYPAAYIDAHECIKASADGRAWAVVRYFI